MQKVISVKMSGLPKFAIVEVEHSFLGMFKRVETTVTNIEECRRAVGSDSFYPEHVRKEIYVLLAKSAGE